MGLIFSTLRGVFMVCFMALNTVALSIPVFLLVPVKFIIPLKGWRVFWTRILLGICSLWVSFNSFMLEVLYKTQWNIIGRESLDIKGKYLVACNHQSWADIPVLQRVMSGRAPFLRFFIKDQSTGKNTI